MKDYKKRLSFMENYELLNEFESISNLCEYVSYDHICYQQLKAIKAEFANRGLQALVS